MPVPVSQVGAKPPPMHRRVLLLLAGLLTILILWPSLPDTSVPASAARTPTLQNEIWQYSTAEEKAYELLPQLQIVTPAEEKPQGGDTEHFDDNRTLHYAIEPEDSLSRIFSRFGFSQQQMHQIMAADQSLL